MPGDQERRSRLDQKSTPIAILHAGMYVYANPAFLRLFGYQDFSEIVGVPVLDMVDASLHDTTRKHFVQAAGFTLDSPDLPTARLRMRRKSGTHIGVTTTAHSTTFDGEPCLVMWLRDDKGRAFTEKHWQLSKRFYLSLALLVVFTLLPLTVMYKLNINNAPTVYFPDDEPAIVIDRKLREQFPNDQVYILLFEGIALFSDGFLNAYHQLATQLEQHRLVEKVFGLTTQDHISGSDDGFLVDPLLNVKELDNSNAAQRLERAIADRFARNALVAADGSAISLVIAPVTLDNSIARLKLEQEILSMVNEAHLDTYLSARTGFIPLDIAELRSMLRDNIVFIPVTMIVGLSLVWWLFRRWLAVILGGLAIGAVVSTTVALYALTGRPFTMISSIIPPLLSALTVAALVHFYNALHYAAQRGKTGNARVAHALTEIRRPALFTALTTAAGLMSLGVSPIPAIKSFGLIAAIGVLLVYLVIIHILPPLFERWDRKPWPHTGTGLRWMDVFVKHLFSFGVRHPVWVIAMTVLLLGAGLPALWQIKVETNLQEFFLPDHPVRRDTDYFEKKMAGTGSLDVVFETEQDDGLKNPEYLQFMRDFQSWVEALPAVDKSMSPADFIEEMHWGFNAEQQDQRRIPDDARLISQYLFIYDGEDLFDFIDPDFRIAHVNLSINVHAANDISAVMNTIRDNLRERTPAGLNWEIAGYSRSFADMEELLVSGQVYSLWGALVLVFMLMLVQWRSLGDSLLCMIPNISPILLIFIVMGLTGIWLDMATAMIASIAVGIAVDDTIHVYHGYSSRMKAGMRPVAALARTFKQAGRAVMTTTIILSAQFIVLTTSQFQPTANFGLLTSVGLWAALVFDLLLLPAILILLSIYKEKMRIAHNTPRGITS